MKSETIRIPGVHYTLKQLLDMDRVPVPGNPGETRWNNRYCHTACLQDYQYITFYEKTVYNIYEKKMKKSRKKLHKIKIYFCTKFCVIFSRLSRIY